MKTEHRTFDFVDLPLGTGRSIRAGVTRDAEGEPDRLILVPTWEGSGPDHRHRIDLPASILPELRRALEQLEVEGR